MWSKPPICFFFLFYLTLQIPTIWTDLASDLTIEKAYYEFENPNPTDSPPFNPDRDNFTLAGLSSKTWEGPYFQQASIGSVVFMPCALTEKMISQLFQQRSFAAQSKYFWAIVWTHQNWDGTIDPWLGDGRRSYDPLTVAPYWDADMKVKLEQGRLTILDTNPTDNGVYVCSIALYSQMKGFAPIILSQSDLVSVHFLRVQSGFRPNSLCRPGDTKDNVYCQTGFEPWTHNIYYPTGAMKGDVIFQAECQIDLILTALSLGGVDPTFWSIGWRFVPEDTIDDTGAAELDDRLRMDLRNPVHICQSTTLATPTVPCVYSDDRETRVEHQIGKRDLLQAQAQAAKLWRARWLVLTGTEPQQSGRWQCWLQGLGMTTHKTTKSIPVRWFIDEFHVHILGDTKDIYRWWTTTEFWRILGLITAPGVFFLIGLIMAVGRTAAYLHPEKIPPRKQIKLAFEATSTPAVAREVETENFEPTGYLYHFLNRQGIESYGKERRRKFTMH